MRLSSVLSHRRLPALDGLRALSVGVVMAFHAGVSVPADLGVTCFFVISGFLITWLMVQEWQSSGAVNLPAFYIRRTLRIFPAYYTLVLFGIATSAAFGSGQTNGQIASALSYTVNYYNAFHSHHGAPAHAWSLAVEEQFYLLWPPLFLWLAMKGRRALVSSLCLAIGAACAWSTAGYLSGTIGIHYIYNAFETRMGALAIGCLLAVLSTHPRADQAAHALVCRPWAPLLTVATLAMSRLGLGLTWHYTAGFTVDALLLGVLLVQVLQLHDRAGYRWLSHPVSVWIGVLSYSLYLWHSWGYDLAGSLGSSVWVRLGVGTPLAFVLAWGSRRFVELPFQALRPRALAWLARRRGAADQVVAPIA